MTHKFQYITIKGKGVASQNLGRGKCTTSERSERPKGGLVVKPPEIILAQHIVPLDYYFACSNHLLTKIK